ncbi:unnamed protein product, partial [Choristocarpus tenellus]
EISSVPKPILSGIKAVASDVDGTLTSPEGKVSARTKSTIKAIMDEGLVFFPATGKTRAGMYAVLGDQLGAELKAKDVPGVFIQGLIVYSGAGDDVLYERLLELDVIKAVTNFCRDRGMSVIAYSGDRIVCSKRDEQTDKITDYLEPTPEAIGSLEEAAAGGLPIHKLILMDTTENIDDVRPEVERLVGDVATLTQCMLSTLQLDCTATSVNLVSQVQGPCSHMHRFSPPSLILLGMCLQALSDMLEVLPLGASKGKGVAVLLEHLGIDPRHLMAMGDAENDVGMLQLAGIGVCMGNASPAAIAAADYVTLSNKENGAAVAMETLLGVITSKSK